MTRKPWKEPTLDDLLADPILDVLLAHDRVSRDELLAVVERARRALAATARERLAEVEAPAGADFLPSPSGTQKPLPCWPY